MICFDDGRALPRHGRIVVETIRRWWKLILGVKNKLSGTWRSESAMKRMTWRFLEGIWSWTGWHLLEIRGLFDARISRECPVRSLSTCNTTESKWRTGLFRSTGWTRFFFQSFPSTLPPIVCLFNLVYLFVQQLDDAWLHTFSPRAKLLTLTELHHDSNSTCCQPVVTDEDDATNRCPLNPNLLDYQSLTTDNPCLSPDDDCWAIAKFWLKARYWCVCANNDKGFRNWYIQSKATTYKVKWTKVNVILRHQAPTSIGWCINRHHHHHRHHWALSSDWLNNLIPHVIFTREMIFGYLHRQVIE